MEKPSKEIQKAFMNIAQFLIDENVYDDAFQDIKLIGKQLGFTEEYLDNIYKDF